MMSIRHWGRKCKQRFAYNHCPISVLSALSQIFERSVLNQFISPMEIFWYQIYMALDPGWPRLTAWDNKSPRWRKLCNFHFSRPKWGIWYSQPLYSTIKTWRIWHTSYWKSVFRSYLTKRKQKVFVNGVESDFVQVNSGVPQGLILGLVLFLVYINDIVIATNYFSIRLFADGTSLIVTGKDFDFLLQRINSELPAKGFVQMD